MSIFAGRNVLVSSCGAAIGCTVGYTFGVSYQMIALAGSIGTVALSCIYKALPETGFQPFTLDIKNFNYLGQINNRHLFALSNLGNEDVCAFLRKMDLKEYDLVKKDHDESVESRKLSAGPIISGFITSAGMTVFLTLLLGPFGSIAAFLEEMGVLIVFSGIGEGVVHYFYKIESPKELMDGNRTYRLSSKINEISARISTLEHRGGYSREVLQLRNVRNCFERTLQANSKKNTPQ